MSIMHSIPDVCLSDGMPYLRVAGCCCLPSEESLSVLFCWLVCAIRLVPWVQVGRIINLYNIGVSKLVWSCACMHAAGLIRHQRETSQHCAVLACFTPMFDEARRTAETGGVCP